ncbi:MAG: type III-B CRISPR module RAMP protein Cmr4 [Saprospiraceae bacterium]|jgi:CRISPR-associated protein Cmr4|nr:type III-B CRISPR module RAMP protein Cmr4 [Saprospiraceae bacterium]
MATTTDLFMITCITNMHAGSGGTNYGIIDNLVQRDPATGYPTIHATSLKGALREFFESNFYPKQKVTKDVKEVEETHEVVKHIFGSDVNEGGDKTAPGKYKFFSAHLLSIPVRSNKKPYFNATSPKAVNEFVSFSDIAQVAMHNDKKDTLREFAKLSGTCLIFENIANAMIEGKNATFITIDTTMRERVETFIGKYAVLFNDAAFAELIDGLPVIARNQLENGISNNLWYEEIVPRQSRFYFAVMHDGKHFEEFKTKLESKMVQIGANATVGYGFCKIEKLSTP